jgi:hypothetical protein
MNSFRTSSSALIVVSLLMTLISGCGGKPEEPKPPPPVKDTIFGDLVDTKDRAKKETEQAMELHKQQMEQAMKKNEE